MKIKSFLILLFFSLQNDVYSFDYVENNIDSIISTKRISYNDNAHNAFTDLVFFKNNFYCVFRSAKSHVGNDGSIVILTSKNAEEWEFLKKIKIKGVDLRDPKFIVSKKRKMLYIHIGGSIYEDKLFIKKNHYLLKFQKGKYWSSPQLININNKWLWKPIIFKDSSLVFGYKIGEKLSLYKSADLIKYNKIKDLDLDPKGILSETCFAFDEHKNLIALVRKNYPGSYLGISKEPFLKWEWKKLDKVLGGPNMMVINNRIIISGRTYDLSKPNDCRTKTFVGEIIGNKIKILHYLRSGGDTGYTGMVYKDGMLYISYNSGLYDCINTDNTNTEVYLSKIKL